MLRCNTESPAQVPDPLCLCFLALWRRIAMPDQQISLQHLLRQAGIMQNMPGDFSRLVKAAAEKPPAMQRYRDHHIDLVQQ